jgi:hypothetical protein
MQTPRPDLPTILIWLLAAGIIAFVVIRTVNVLGVMR